MKYLLLVEGETDALTLWHHGYPALGLPGATNIKCLKLEHVTGFDTVLVVSEPDVAGQKFPTLITDHLREVGYAGTVSAIAMGPTGYKDPAALHCADPLAFRAKFDALIAEALKPQPERDPQQVGPYAIGKRGETLFHRVHNTGGSREITVTDELANFNARLREDLVCDDGLEQERLYKLEVNGPGAAKTLLEVKPEDFHTGRWLSKLTGAAIVASGNAARDKLRHAIQMLSPNVARRVIHTHCGWREIDGEFWYLHAGGAIGAETVRRDICAELPESLDALRLPEPPDGAELREAIACAREFVEIGDPRVTYPLFASIWRAAVGEARFGVFVIGQSAIGKTSLAGAMQSFYGAGFSRDHLPAGWDSTANSLSNLTFQAKDALFVLDDFRPPKDHYDRRVLMETAERLFRAQANQRGRDRLTSDARNVKRGRFPRGLLVATGEDYPVGSSLVARMVVVNLAPNDMDRRKLYAYSQVARAGLPAAAMAGWVRWLASRPQVRTRIEKRAEELLIQHLTGAEGEHAREVNNLMELIATLEVWQEFAGVRLPNLDAVFENKEIEQREERAAYSDEASNFLDLLTSALRDGLCHAETVHGQSPGDRGAQLGWRLDKTGSYQAQGPAVLFFDTLDGEIFLDIDTAHSVICSRVATDSNRPTASVRMLTRLLAENGFLANVNEGSERQKHGYVRRKMVDGVTHRWLQIEPKKFQIRL